MRKYFVITTDDIIRYAGNFARDFFWALTAAMGCDIKGKPSEEFWPQTIAQFTFASANAFMLMVAIHCCSRHRGIIVDNKKTIAAFLALSAAIITWNLGQLWGENFARHKGMSNKNAGYFAGIDTGLMEGPPVQFILYEMLLLAMNHLETRERYSNYFHGGKKGVARGATHYAMNLLTGGFAGCVWQLVYNAVFPDCKNHCTDPTAQNVFLVATAVAFSVATANYLTTVVNNMAGMFFDKHLLEEMPTQVTTTGYAALNI